MSHITNFDILDGQAAATFATSRVYERFTKDPHTIVESYEQLRRAVDGVDQLMTDTIPYLDSGDVDVLTRRMQGHILPNLEVLKEAAASVKAGKGDYLAALATSAAIILAGTLEAIRYKLELLPADAQSHE